jgi:3-oxoacyl-[acyl-carrier-protein] synthase III
METSDEWIRERTGIEERRFAVKGEDTTTSMGVKAAKVAIERSTVSKDDIDFIIFATLSPDYYFPGPGVLVQRDLEIGTAGALMCETNARVLYMPFLWPINSFAVVCIKTYSLLVLNCIPMG